jgi:hypothetical protein
MNETASVSAPAVKIGSAWALVGITSWADAAAALAAVYSLILILEWIWKKFTRPFLERKGIVKRTRRRRSDE